MAAALAVGTLRNYDSDGNENVGLMSKKQLYTCIMLFLYISLLSLHNYDVK